jgi:ATP-dependent DNA helicase RecG
MRIMKQSWRHEPDPQTEQPVEPHEVNELIALLRACGTDLTDVEVKAAAGGTPKSLRETLSAFSNGHGGTILLGLDESSGFRPAPGFDAKRVRDAVAGFCADGLEPAVRADIDIVPVDGIPVLVVAVPELDPRHKPCFVKARGEYQGSFIRSGDGDRRLTDYEIHSLHANRGQPLEDRELVSGASLDDLDAAAVGAMLRRVRERQPRAFRDVSDEVALQRLNVVARSEHGLIPTLAGLLALGAYPQQYFPQLNVTFIVVPGTSLASIPEDGPRFIDNRTFDGPIPLMVEDSVAAVLRNMNVRSFVEGVGRRDVYDYPVEAVREAIVNALIHRDYSSYARGTQIQIEMYADRLVIRSAGGLFGAVTEDDLGSEGISSSRNAVLAKLLQDVLLPGTSRVVCENRGSGIPTMINVLRRAGMAPPEFQSRITTFTLTIAKHALLNADITAWIEGLGQQGLTSTQHMALALLSEGRMITGQTLRNLGLDGRRATVELEELVNRGLAVRIGERRHARYVLGSVGSTVSATEGTGVRRPKMSKREAEIFALFQPGETLTRQDVESRSGLGSAMANRVLARLVDLGLVSATAPPRSHHRRYQLLADPLDVTTP